MEWFDGERALEHVRQQVALGPRPPGSPGAHRLRAYIREHLGGWSVEEQRFIASTPRGPIAMANLVARYPEGPIPEGILLGAHADTKVFDEFEFVGANDGGSGVAALLELARVIPGMNLKTPVTLAFLDGEEAQVAWGRGDGLYGSRELVGSWFQHGLLQQLRAALILDIIGDTELVVTRDLYSTEWLQDLVWDVAREQGLEDVFDGPLEHIQDDHLPFLAGKVPALVLIGFGHDPFGDYFPPYWHTPGDTLDKVSALSLQRVGRVVQGALERLQPV